MEMECREEFMKRLPFWEELSSADREQLLAASYLRSFEPGSLIHTQDGDCLGLLYVCEGDVRTSMTSEEGREITLYHLRDGDYDVLSASCVVNQITFDAQMTTVRKCTLLIIPASVLGRFKAENIYVRSFIYETLTTRFSDVMWMMQQTLFLRVDQRIAGYLLELYEETGAPELAITHEQIALEINTAREVVARMMRNFVSDGLVEGGRGRIVIRDPEGLRRVN